MVLLRCEGDDCRHVLGIELRTARARFRYWWVQIRIGDENRCFRCLVGGTR